jgi:hypothetical protein
MKKKWQQCTRLWKKYRENAQWRAWSVCIAKEIKNTDKKVEKHVLEWPKDTLISWYTLLQHEKEYYASCWLQLHELRYF